VRVDGSPLLDLSDAAIIGLPPHVTGADVVTPAISPKLGRFRFWRRGKVAVEIPCVEGRHRFHVAYCLSTARKPVCAQADLAMLAEAVRNKLGAVTTAARAR
jgi:hypothetical protein